jgi:hypothetical protein
MSADSFDLLGSTVTPLHIERGSSSLRGWRTPAAAATPPPHRHWHNSEGFCVVRGVPGDADRPRGGRLRGGLVRSDQTGAIAHSLEPRRRAGEIFRDDHPTGSRGLFRRAGQAPPAKPSPAEAQTFREELFAHYDVEMQGLTPLNARVHDQKSEEKL